jgi:hypothetical protein
LLSLNSTDTNTDMGSSYHIDIIRTITNSQSDYIRMSLLNHSYDISFLFWRHSAGKKYLTWASKFKELLFDSLRLHNFEKWITCDDSGWLTKTFRVYLHTARVSDLLKNFSLSLTINDIHLHFLV